MSNPVNKSDLLCVILQFLRLDTMKEFRSGMKFSVHVNDFRKRFLGNSIDRCVRLTRVFDRSQGEVEGRLFAHESDKRGTNKIL